ncbi:hypothetical protein [Streptomyces sp. GbtcB6]|uniref:hypothetical protein n=1 Tax=Streptomyces sp. GbtcB6 TaxID=2824751 RepID=UPI0020C6A099|nr:hypothetical protein [Streptomyces sp. GbtcB6]
MGALARALRLDALVLLELLDAATGQAAMAEGNVPGRLIAQWDAHDLEIHPAADVPAPGADRPGGQSGRGRSAALPSYVRRPHDEELARVVATAEAGHSAMAVLVGSSSTGKTRACWEAVQLLAASGWRLWHPFDPTHAESALAELVRVTPHTVVWLNETQHYLAADGGIGERIAAAVHSLLTDPARAPVLVLGTLWPHYAHRYTAPHLGGGNDPYPRVREEQPSRPAVRQACRRRRGHYRLVPAR